MGPGARPDPAPANSTEDRSKGEKTAPATALSGRSQRRKDPNAQKPSNRDTSHPGGYRTLSPKMSPSLRTAIGQQLSTEQPEGRVRTAQRTLHSAQALPHIPGTGRTETLKKGKKRSTGSRTAAGGHTQTRQTEVPQIMAVAARLSLPLSDTRTREARAAVRAVHTGHSASGQLQQEHSGQSTPDHISREMLVRHAEVGKVADSAPTTHAQEAVHTKPGNIPVGKHYAAFIRAMSLHTPRTLTEGADWQTRRTQFTPTGDVRLDIGAERTKVSAWFRGWFLGAVFVAIDYGSTQYLPETFLTIFPGDPGRFHATAQLCSNRRILSVLLNQQTFGHGYRNTKREQRQNLWLHSEEERKWF